MEIRKHIPNAITSCNLLSGCIGISLCFEGNIFFGAVMILIGATFDFFDGFAARMLKVSSPMGKELDSLADMVTFGVLPSVILYQLLVEVLADSQLTYLPYVAFLIAVFSAVRLANFNIDERQSDGFIGVPTPGTALVIGSLPLILKYYPEFSPYILNEITLIGIAIVMSYLMNAEIPLISLKFKTFGWKGNEGRFILIGSSLLLLIFLQVAALPLIVVTQVLISALFRKKK